jgi:hypothetical protein
MAIIGRIGANSISYPYMKCDVKDCGREVLIEGVKVANGAVLSGRDYQFPKGWVSVTISSNSERSFDACSQAHAARLFPRKLTDAVAGK